MALTEKQLKSSKNFPTDRAHNDVADGGGMVVRFYKTAQIAFYFRFRWEKKAAIIKLGNYPQMTLKEAREKTASFKDLLANGVDPRRDGQKIDHNDKWTVERAFRDFIENQLSGTVSTGHFKSFSRIAEQYIISQVGSCLWSDLKPKDWLNVIQNCQYDSIRERLLSMIKRVNGYLMIQEIINEDKVSVLNGRMFPQYKASENSPIPYSVLKPLLKGCMSRGIHDPYAAAWVIQILMGSRQREIRRIELDDINFEERVWIVPAHKSKAGNIITRPILDFMFPYFECLVINRFDINSSFLFKENSIDDGKNSGGLFYYYLKKICIELTGHGLKPHHTRHTLSTRFADLDIHPFVGEKLLGHVMVGSMRIYNKGQYLKELRNAISIWREQIINWE